MLYGFRRKLALVGWGLMSMDAITEDWPFLSFISFPIKKRVILSDSDHSDFYDRFKSKIDRLKKLN